MPKSCQLRSQKIITLKALSSGKIHQAPCISLVNSSTSVLSSFSGPNSGLYLYQSQPRPLQQLHPLSRCGLDTILCQEANSVLGTGDGEKCGSCTKALPDSGDVYRLPLPPTPHPWIPLDPSERITVVYGYPTELHFPTSLGLRRVPMTKFLTKVCAGSDGCHFQVQDMRRASSTSSLSRLAGACIWC